MSDSTPKPNSTSSGRNILLLHTEAENWVSFFWSANKSCWFHELKTHHDCYRDALKDQGPKLLPMLHQMTFTSVKWPSDQSPHSLLPSIGISRALNTPCSPHLLVHEYTKMPAANPQPPVKLSLPLVCTMWLPVCILSWFADCPAFSALTCNSNSNKKSIIFFERKTYWSFLQEG